MLAKANAAGLCRYFPLGALTKGMEGEDLCDFGTLKASGCVAFSDDGLPVMNAEIMRRALEYTAWLNLPSSPTRRINISRGTATCTRAP